MINRLFGFVSQGSGITLAAMVVGAMSLHTHDGAADAEIRGRAIAMNDQDRATHPSTTNTIKAGAIPGVQNSGHLRLLAMYYPGHPWILG